MIEPVADRFLDTDEFVPAFETPVRYGRLSCDLALFVDREGLPIYARLTIPGLEGDEIPTRLGPLIVKVREHLLTVLRLTFRGDVNLFPYFVYSFIEPASSYSFGLDMSIIRGKHTFDIERSRRLFESGAKYMEELRLLVDGLDSRIPLQYQYLSLYKILELHYKPLGRWRHQELDRTLASFEEAFRDKGVAQRPSSYLHSLRDKCAHVRTGRGKRNSYGVSQLREEESRQVSDILPILADVCATVLNERSGGTLRIQHVGDRGGQLGVTDAEMD